MIQLHVRNNFQTMSVPYQEVFSRKPSPVVRWLLSPFLIIFEAVFFIPLFDAMSEGRQVGVIATSLAIILCFCGALALWGVPYIGRVVTAIITFSSGYYLVDECFINFSGDWGWSRSRSSTTPINSIVAFFVFGLPCLIYTILGRFTLRPKPELADDFEDYVIDEYNDEENEN